MEPHELRSWIDAHGYTVTAFAQALGVGRRTVHRYLDGTTPIPRTVELALRGLEAQTNE